MIDVHHHFNPDYKDNEGRPWSVQMSLDELGANGVAGAVGCLGVVKVENAAERSNRARSWNEWATRICLDHPKTFGLFAALPLPDVDASLVEIGHAFDVLRADGISLATNYGDTWLGDRAHWPVLEELNRRAAVAFVHPYATSRCQSISAEYGGGEISAPWLEFPMNTARAILGLMTSGATRAFPNIRFIFAHGGGVMPLMLGRIAGFEGWPSVGPSKLTTLFPDGVRAEFAKFYFECAQAYAPEGFGLLRKLVPTERLLFGSDFSYFPVSHSVGQFRALDLPEADRIAIGGGNAAALFPRFAEP